MVAGGQEVPATNAGWTASFLADLKRVVDFCFIGNHNPPATARLEVIEKQQECDRKDIQSLISSVAAVTQSVSQLTDSMKSLNDLKKYVLYPITVAFILAVIGFIWAVASGTIVIVTP